MPKDVKVASASQTGIASTEVLTSKNLIVNNLPSDYGQDAVVPAVLPAAVAPPI